MQHMASLAEDRLGGTPEEARGLLNQAEGIGLQQPDFDLNPGLNFGRGTSEVIAATALTVTSGLATGLAIELLGPLIAYFRTLDSVYTQYSVAGRAAGFTAALSRFVHANRILLSDDNLTESRIDFISWSSRHIPFRSAATLMGNSTAARYSHFGYALGKAFVASVASGRARRNIDHLQQAFYPDISDESLYQIIRAFKGNIDFQRGINLSDRQHQRLIVFARELYSQYGYRGHPDVHIFEPLWQALMGPQETPASVASDARAAAGITPTSNFVGQMAVGLAPDVFASILRSTPRLLRALYATTSRLTLRPFRLHMDSELASFFTSIPASHATSYNSMIRTLHRIYRNPLTNREHFRQTISSTMDSFIRYPKLVRTPDNFAELAKLHNTRQSFTTMAEARTLELLTHDSSVQAIYMIRQGRRRSPDFVALANGQYFRIEVTTALLQPSATQREIYSRVRRAVRGKLNRLQLITPIPYLPGAVGGWITVRLRVGTGAPVINYQNMAQHIFSLFASSHPELTGVRIFVGNQLVGFGS